MNKMFEYVNELGRTPVIPLLGFPGLKFLGNSISQGDVRDFRCPARVHDGLAYLREHDIHSQGDGCHRR